VDHLDRATHAMDAISSAGPGADQALVAHIMAAARDKLTVLGRNMSTTPCHIPGLPMFLAPSLRQGGLRPRCFLSRCPVGVSASRARPATSSLHLAA
jgi:hypothetical protein